jgi:hypothetical protein
VINAVLAEQSQRHRPPRSRVFLAARIKTQKKMIATVAAFDPEQQQASWREDDGITPGLVVERDGGLVAYVMTRATETSLSLCLARFS